MLKHWVGAHVSVAGGVHESIPRILQHEGLSCAIFLKNHWRWEGKPYESSVIEEFKARAKAANIDPKKQILPHGSYLVNLANPNSEPLEKSKAAFLDELQRCEQLGIGLFNMHPGSAVGGDKELAIRQIAESLNEMIRKTKFVKIILENMTNNGDRIVGTQLEDLRDVIDLIEVKSRVGVCIDTCHAFSAGYDLRDEKAFEEFWDKFDRIIGREYLSALHLNDSKAPFGKKRDLHQSIGIGYLGLEPFRLIMNNPRFHGIPLILETPEPNEEIRSEEIALLKWLVGKEKHDKEFIKKAADLALVGEKERNEMMNTIRKQEEKAAEKEAKAIAKEEKAAAKEAAKRAKTAKHRTTKRAKIEVEVEEITIKSEG